MCRWVHGWEFDAPGCGSYLGYLNNDGYTDHYWTSQQADSNSAVETWMPGGNDYRTVGKDTNYVSARPVRYFGGSTSMRASITADQPRSNSRTVGFTLYVSESITGLTSSDLSNTGTAQGCQATPAASSGTTIHVSVTCTSDGTVVLALAAGSVSGTSGTGPTTAVNSSKVSIDSTAPTLTVTNAPAVVVAGSSIQVAIDERGTVYMVGTGVTVTQRSDITSLADSAWNSVSLSDTSTHPISSIGLAADSYHFIAIDLAGNVSAPSASTVTVRAAQSCTTVCAVGDTGPGGGVVFYDAGSTQSWGRYMEVAPTVASPSGERPWCDSNTVIAGADGTAIGTGRSNSLAIAGACTTAAAIDAMAYAGGGLSDWFLPSKGELVALCDWEREQVGGSPCSAGWNWTFPPILSGTWHLWSSTQIDATNAWDHWMPGGLDFRSVPKSGPGWGIAVRPIRYF